MHRALVASMSAVIAAAVLALPSNAHAAVQCGATAADFAGTYVLEEFPDVTFTFNADGQTMHAKHLDQPVGEGTYTAGDGKLHWELNGVSTDSTKVECANPCSSRVIRVEGIDSDGEQGVLKRP